MEKMITKQEDKFKMELNVINRGKSPCIHDFLRPVT